MDRSNFVICKRSLVGTVANTNGNALESFLNAGSTIQIEDLDLFDFPCLDTVYAGDDPLCLHIIRGKHGNIPGAVWKAGRRADSALLVCKCHELFKIQFKRVNRLLYSKARLHCRMNFTESS